MGYIALNCPNCGAQLDLDDNRDFGFCQYCGTKVVREKTIIEHTGTVKIEGMADIDSLLKRAFILIESGDFKKADECLDKVLALNPKCAKAYMGELLCQLELKNIELLDKHYKPLDKYANYLNAIRFSDGEEKKKYEQYNDGKREKCDRFIQKKTAELKEKQSDFEQQKSALDKKEKLYKFFKKYSENKKTFYSVLGILLVLVLFAAIVIDQNILLKISAVFGCLLIAYCIGFLIIYPPKYIANFKKGKKDLGVLKQQLINEKEAFDKMMKNIDKQE